MKLIAVISIAMLLSLGCNENKQNDNISFEIRGFVVSESKQEASAFTPAWNEFKGKGILVSDDISKDRNIAVCLEGKDKTVGANSTPMEIWVLLRGGLGEFSTYKGDYGKISSRPDYEWAIVGWYELFHGTIHKEGDKTDEQ